MATDAWFTLIRIKLAQVHSVPNPWFPTMTTCFLLRRAAFSKAGVWFKKLGSDRMSL